jgi:hypothetical protein
MRLPLFLALASLAGCVSPVQIGESNLPIINGTADTGDPAVMLLIAQPVGSNRVGLCTATLVSPHVLLTAAHCVDPATFQADMGAAPQLKYYVSTTNMLTMPIDPKTVLPVKTTMFDQQFNPDPGVFVNLGHDVGAVVLFSPPPGIQPVPYNKMPLPQSLVGQQARIIGYGVTSATDTTGMTAGTKRQTNITISALDSKYVEFQDGSHGICEGDSGGPALVMLNGVETIVGVTAFGEQGCPLDKPSADTRIDTYVSEIDGWVASADSGGTGGGGNGGNGADAGTGGSMSNAHSGCSMSTGNASLPALFLIGFTLLGIVARRRRV